MAIDEKVSAAKREIFRFSCKTSAQPFPTLVEAYDLRCQEVTKLSEAHEEAKQDLKTLQEHVFKTNTFCLKRFKSMPTSMVYNTGFENYAMFRTCANFLKLYSKGSVVEAQ